MGCRVGYRPETCRNRKAPWIHFFLEPGPGTVSDRLEDRRPSQRAGLRDRCAWTQTRRQGISESQDFSEQACKDSSVCKEMGCCRISLSRNAEKSGMDARASF